MERSDDKLRPALSCGAGGRRQRSVTLAVDQRAGAAIALLALALLMQAAHGGLLHGRVKGLPPYNIEYDWQSKVTVQGNGSCRFAPVNTKFQPPRCPPPSRRINRTEAAALGWKFMPLLYQHPSDPSWLTDPARWFNEVSVQPERGDADAARLNTQVVVTKMERPWHV